MRAIHFLHYIFLLLLLSAAGLVSAVDNNPFIERFTHGTSVVVAVEDEYFPFSYIDPHTGRRVGFDVDFARLLCRELKVDYKLVPMPFAEILQAVEDGRVDLGVCGVGWTQERAGKMLFSKPYYRSRTIFVGRAGADSLDVRYQTARGLKLGTQTGTLQAQALEQYFGQDNEITLCDNYKQLFEAVASGELDAILVDGLAGYQYMKMESSRDLVLIGALADIDLPGIDSHIVLNLEDRAGVKLVDAAITRILLSGDYQMISLQYFPFITY